MFLRIIATALIFSMAPSCGKKNTSEDPHGIPQNTTNAQWSKDPRDFDENGVPLLPKVADVPHSSTKFDEIIRLDPKTYEITSIINFQTRNVAELIYGKDTSYDKSKQYFMALRTRTFAHTSPILKVRKGARFMGGRLVRLQDYQLNALHAFASTSHNSLVSLFKTWNNPWQAHHCTEDIKGVHPAPGSSYLLQGSPVLDARKVPTSIDVYPHQHRDTPVFMILSYGRGITESRCDYHLESEAKLNEAREKLETLYKKLDLSLDPSQKKTLPEDLKAFTRASAYREFTYSEYIESWYQHKVRPLHYLSPVESGYRHDVSPTVTFPVKITFQVTIIIENPTDTIEGTDP